MVGQAIATGNIVHAAPDAPKTICDALQPTATKPLNLGLLQGRAAPGVTVTDTEVRTAQRFAFANLHLVLEPGGAAALAAALAGKVPVDADTGHHADRRQCRSGGLCPDALGGMTVRKRHIADTLPAYDKSLT